MISQRPEMVAALAGSMRSSVSRRRLLQAAGISGTAAALAACGAGGGSASDPTQEPTTEETSAAETPKETAAETPTETGPEDLSDVEKVIAWSNWPLYIDYDDEEVGRPTLEAFSQQTGIEVTYNEDINDNNEFFAKVRTQLEQGQDIERDLVVLTDWMAGLWIRSGFAQKLDKANIPNMKNLVDEYYDVSFDPGREYSLPWQSGFGGLAYNVDLLESSLGVSEITTMDQLFDPALKGRITLLSEMQDTMGCMMAWQGADPSNFTDAEFENAIDKLTEIVSTGQVRQVTGNDYINALETGDIIACIGWSGDVFAMDGNYGFSLPESGGMLWSDNMLIPSTATHKKNAEAVMNYYYEPEIAAEVAAWVWYISPVKGAREAMEAIDPELVEVPWIFPTEKELTNSYVFMTLTPEQNEKYQRLFQQAIGL